MYSASSSMNGQNDVRVQGQSSDLANRQDFGMSSLPKNLKGNDTISDSQDREAMELYSRAKAQQEEILYLREQIALASVRESQLLNEKYELEKKFSELRMALDEKQSEAIISASNELARRKGDLEENLRLVNELKKNEHNSPENRQKGGRLENLDRSIVNCHRLGHTHDICYTLHGPPPNNDPIAQMEYNKFLRYQATRKPMFSQVALVAQPDAFAFAGSSFAGVSQSRSCLSEVLFFFQDTEDDKYIFMSSMLGLLAEYGIFPRAASASSLTNNVKHLHDQLEMKIRTSHVRCVLDPHTRKCSAGLKRGFKRVLLSVSAVANTELLLDETRLRKVEQKTTVGSSMGSPNASSIEDEYV
ncbi:hypothetical protein FXO37_03161 [Capsicum annuum]|nr:hypothetical protein FXO37_03161 [Capsicum annuum]